ncbi:MAG: amidohydrolase family protein [Lautropia sp.]
MVVDMRVRPAIPSFIATGLYQGPGKTDHPSFPRLPSTQARSIPLMLEEMADAGVSYGVVPGRYSLPPFGTVPNEELDQLVSAYPGRLGAFMGLDLRWTTERMLAEMAQWLARPGFVGVAIEPTISLEPSITRMDDRRLYPIYEECVRRDVPVSVTLSGVLQAFTRQPYELSDPVQAYRVALDFPTLDIHIGHAGYPWVMNMIGVCMACPNVWLSPDLYLTSLFPGVQDYATAALNYFPTRTVFGTGYPVKPFAQMIEAYRAWGWPAEIQEAVLDGNARRLLRIG